MYIYCVAHDFGAIVPQKRAVKVGVYIYIYIDTTVDQILCSVFPKNGLIVKILLSKVLKWCILRHVAPEFGANVPKKRARKQGVCTGVM